MEKCRFARALTVLTATLTIGLALPQSAAARPHENETLRLGGYLALAFGGEAEGRVGGVSASEGLDVTAGFGLRAEVPLHEYFLIGGSFELLTFETNGVFSERESIFDIDVWARGRYPIDLGSFTIEPYVGVPLGLSLAVLANPARGSDDRVWPGWNIGILAGAALVFEAPFSVFVEVGWRHHQVFTSVDVAGGTLDYELATHQFAVQLGAAFILD